jgi:F0F1-type ATP synthase membrane subunit c/vacuolar-type H+-ATPase subunit K
MYSRIFTVFIMAAAMAEALGLLGLVLAFISMA